jgi:hypothetical protein
MWKASPAKVGLFAMAGCPFPLMEAGIASPPRGMTHYQHNTCKGTPTRDSTKHSSVYARAE